MPSTSQSRILTVRFTSALLVMVTFFLGMSISQAETKYQFKKTEDVRSEGVTDKEVLTKLQALKDKDPVNKDEFLRLLKDVAKINSDDVTKYQDAILRAARYSKSQELLVALDSTNPEINAFRELFEQFTGRKLDELKKEEQKKEVLKIAVSKPVIPTDAPTADDPGRIAEKTQIIIRMDQLVLRRPVLAECYLHFIFEQSGQYFFLFDDFRSALVSSFPQDPSAKSLRLGVELPPAPGDQELRLRIDLIKRLATSLKILNGTGMKKFFNIVFDYVDDDNPGIKQFAVLVLQSSLFPAPSNLIRPTFSKDIPVELKNRFVAQLAIAVSNPSDRDALASLAEIAANPNEQPNTRAEAIKALGNSMNRFAISKLAILAADLNNRKDVAANLKTLTAFWKDRTSRSNPIKEEMFEEYKTAVDKLLEILANDPKTVAFDTVTDSITVLGTIANTLTDENTKMRRSDLVKKMIEPLVVKYYLEGEAKPENITRNTEIATTLGKIGPPVLSVQFPSSRFASAIDLLKFALFNSSGEKQAIQNAIAAILENE